jgi:hypothetical protein
MRGRGLKLQAGIVVVAGLLLACGSTAWGAGDKPLYPLLVNAHGLRVYGPYAGPNFHCPHLLPLPANALRIVSRAVTLAMPPFEAQLKLDGRDPRVRVLLARRSGFGPGAGGCGIRTWNRSVVAFVQLPHVPGASMAQHTFAVARTRAGWLLWDWIH